MEFISLRFTGNGVAPSNTRCKDLAGVISAMEDLIAALVENDEEEDDAPKLCLASIEDRSLQLKCTGSAVEMPIINGAWHGFGAVVESRRFEKLTPKARESFGDILSFVKKKECSAELSDSRDNIVFARFDSTIALPKDLTYKGNSTILGSVVRVGGSKPKVGLKLNSGRVVSCDASEIIAKDLGHRLYETVSCKGLAKWDLASGQVLKFKIESVTSFKKVPASQAFEELALAMPSTIEAWRTDGLDED